MDSHFIQDGIATDRANRAEEFLSKDKKHSEVRHGAKNGVGRQLLAGASLKILGGGGRLWPLRKLIMRGRSSSAENRPVRLRARCMSESRRSIDR
jgi:hypothetical protein